MRNARVMNSTRALKRVKFIERGFVYCGNHSDFLPATSYLLKESGSEHHNFDKRKIGFRSVHLKAKTCISNIIKVNL